VTGQQYGGRRHGMVGGGRGDVFRSEGSAMSSTRYEGVQHSEASGWVAWLLFAAVMLILIGTFDLVTGLIALFNDGYFVVRHENLLVPVSYTAWGWTHIVLALIAFATGFGLMVGAVWARVAGVAVAFLNIIVMFGFMSAYPWLAVLVIIFSLVTMWAIVVHGGEIAEAYG
jgi:hypothetical protein